jgi:hypothetical protein
MLLFFHGSPLYGPGFRDSQDFYFFRMREVIRFIKFKTRCTVGCRMASTIFFEDSRINAVIQNVRASSLYHECFSRCCPVILVSGHSKSDIRNHAIVRVWPLQATAVIKQNHHRRLQRGSSLSTVGYNAYFLQKCFCLMSEIGYSRD